MKINVPAILLIAILTIDSLNAQVIYNLDGGSKPIYESNKPSVTITGRGVISGLEQYHDQILNFKPEIVMRNGKLLEYSTGPRGEYCTYRNPEHKWYNDNDYTFNECSGIILNDPNTVDENTYAFSGNKIISTGNVDYSTVENGIHLYNCDNVLIEGVTITGINQKGIFLEECNNIVIRNCTITMAAMVAIGLLNCDNATIQNCYIKTVYDNGIYLLNTPNSEIIDNVVKDVGIWKGRGNHVHNMGDGVYRNYDPNTAIRIDGSDNMLIKGNRVENIGYNGIGIWGSDYVIVDSNEVINVCLILDDGGGIYAWSRESSRDFNTNIRISNNFIYGVIGTTWSLEGTSEAYLDANAIYIDDGNEQVTVIDNTVINATRGMFIHNSTEVDVLKNDFFNVNGGFLIRGNHSNIYTKNSTIKGNYFGVNEYSLRLWSQSAELNAIWDNNSFNNNIYSLDKIIVDASSWRQDLSLKEWQGNYNQDLNSIIGDVNDTTIIIPEPEPEPEPENPIPETKTPQFDIIQSTYKVFKDDEQVSSHTNIANAIQEMVNIKLSNPSSEVRYETKGRIEEK